MTINDFHSAIKANGEYLTPPDVQRSWADRCFGSLDVWFHLHVVGVFLSGNRSARRGCMDCRAWQQLALRSARAVEQCGGHLHITGADSMADVQGPMVYACNHMSMLETLIAPGVSLTYGDLVLVVKESLLQYPVFGTIMRAVESIGVSRTNPRQDLKTVLKRGQEVLEGGRSMFLFPQATRQIVFNPHEFNSLAVKMAARAGVPVIPVAVKTDFLGLGRVFKDFGPLDRSQLVRIAFGSPVYVDGGQREAHAQVVGFVTGKLKEWGLEVVDAAKQSE